MFSKLWENIKGEYKFDHDAVGSILSSLDFEEIEWLFECCSPIQMGLKIQEIPQINRFFERKGIPLKKLKKDEPEKTLRFADDKWFLYHVFSEWQLRGMIATGRHYDSIKNYKP
jgi:hypothetical protein